MKSRLPWIVAAFALAAVSMGCASTPRSDAATIVVAADGGDLLRIGIDGEWVRSLLAEAFDAEIECDAELDGSLGEMLRALDRRGPRASATLRSGDSVIRARRRGGSLLLDVRGDEGGRLRIDLPWSVAECLLGRSTDLGHALEHVEVVVQGGSTARLRGILGK